MTEFEEMGRLMTESRSLHPTSTFVVRFWREWSVVEERWCGQIEHVQSSESLAFMELAVMVNFIHSFGIMPDEARQEGEERF